MRISSSASSGLPMRVASTWIRNLPGDGTMNLQISACPGADTMPLNATGRDAADADNPSAVSVTDGNGETRNGTPTGPRIPAASGNTLIVTLSVTLGVATDCCQSPAASPRNSTCVRASAAPPGGHAMAGRGKSPRCSAYRLDSLPSKLVSWICTT